MCLKIPLRAATIAFAAFFTASFAIPSLANAEDSALPSDGELVDFGQDVWPILQSKCLECHGPEDAKNDFRVDSEESMGDYIEAGDLESSSLWADYLITDDPDMRMPPADSDVDALTGAELALLKVWIEEGANWSEIADASEPSDEPEIPLSESLSETQKWWRFSGLFHPATVHFPIALLVVSAGFVVLSFINRTAFEPVAFHCLWIGALGAVVSSVVGWSYAQYEGYGAMSFDLGGSSIDRHRWLGIAAAVVAVILIPTARSVRRTGDTGMRLMWMLGSLVAVAAVSIAGYQGGELTYGEDHYLKEYELLFPAEAGDNSPELEEESVEEVDEEGQDESDNASVDEADNGGGQEKEPEGSTEPEVRGEPEEGDEDEVMASDSPENDSGNSEPSSSTESEPAESKEETLQSGETRSEPKEEPSTEAESSASTEEGTDGSRKETSASGSGEKTKADSGKEPSGNEEDSSE